MDFGILLLLALVTLILIGLAWGIIFLIAKAFGVLVGIATRNHPATARIKARAVKIGYAFAISLIAYQIYFAIYPTDSFYLGEFEIATARKAPETTKILFKDASYPDFHGDYCSFSRMEVSRADYDELLINLSNDPRFTGSESSQISVGAMRGVKLPPVKISKSFQRNDVAFDHHYIVSFLDNTTQLEVWVCVT